MLSKAQGITYSVVALFLLTFSAVSAAQPGFDRKDAIRQVKERYPTTQPVDHQAAGIDDGEFLIDTSIAYVPSPTGAHPRVASDSTDYLAVWSDVRSGDGDIYGARC